MRFLYGISTYLMVPSTYNITPLPALIIGTKNDAKRKRRTTHATDPSNAIMRLTDRCVVLTGASSGIGASIAEHLLKEGAKVREKSYVI